MASSTPLRESTTKSSYEYDKFTFTASGKTVIDKGFKKYDLKKKEAKEKILPNLLSGDELEVLDVVIQEKFTKPPQHLQKIPCLKQWRRLAQSLDKDIEVERLDRHACQGQVLLKI